MRTEIKRTQVSNVLKKSVMGCPMIHPIMTIKGVTKSAICIEDPTATPMAKSILSFIATDTAVTCSAALPTIGKRISPKNRGERNHDV